MITDVNEATINITLDSENVMKNLENVESELLWLLSVLRECKRTLTGNQQAEIKSKKENFYG